MSTSVYTQPQQQRDEPQPGRSNRKFWFIISSVLAVVLIASVIYVGVIAYSAVKTLEKNGPIPARYYLNIMDGNYAQAYTYLDSNATINDQHVDMQAFIKLAKAVDSQYGTVHGVQLDSNTNSSRMTVTIDRGSHSYDVHLVLKQEGGTWKIISADGL